MDTSEPINSTFEDRLIHQNTRLEKDKDQVYKNVVIQSIYEEKLANNGLYASIFMHCFIILSTLLIIALKMGLVSAYTDNDKDDDILYFSLFNFDQLQGKHKMSYSYFCFYEDTPAGSNSTVCSVDSCQGLNDTYIAEVFDVNCDHFIQFRVIGIIVSI